MTRIRVAIADDDACSRRLCSLLEVAVDITVVAEVTGRTVDVLQEARPDVLLLGIGASHAHGQVTIAQIRELLPDVRITVLHNQGQDQLVLQALREGALGHLDRDQSQPAEVIAAIRAVSRGEAVVSSSVAGYILDEVIKRR